MLIAIIGLAGLAIDGSRLMSVQTRLQNAADALALPALPNATGGETRLFGRAPQAITSSPIRSPGAGIDQVAQVSNMELLQSLPVSEDLR
jgi:Flp pilus assembly protein TadG